MASRGPFGAMLDGRESGAGLGAPDGAGSPRQSARTSRKTIATARTSVVRSVLAEVAAVRLVFAERRQDLAVLRSLSDDVSTFRGDGCQTPRLRCLRADTGRSSRCAEALRRMRTMLDFW